MRIALLSLLILSGLTSCNPENPEMNGFGAGIFVSNEGPFVSGTGSISFISRGEDGVTNDAYSIANDGESLGNIVQGLARTSDQLIAVVNNADKIVFTDILDLTKIGEITGLQQPRYALVLDEETLAVSEWGERGGSGAGRVSFIDIDSREVRDQVTVGQGPEKMIARDGMLYVCNSGGFGRDSTVSVIDIEAREMETSLVVGPNPQSVVTDASGRLYVICGGVFDFMDPAANIPGALVRVRAGEVEQVTELPTGASDIITDNLRSRAYFLTGDGLQEHIYGSSTAETIKTGSYYECAYDVITGDVLLADAGDFVNRGRVLAVDRESGETMAEYEVGIIPGGFVLK